MPSSDSSRDAALERLAEEFVARHRNGERPLVSEYTDRYPDLANDIRDLFPALMKIERLKPAAGDLTGPDIGAAVMKPPPMERLGDYRVLREVGRGGMGVVYEALQESLGRHVALKVLPPQALLNPTYLERFRREAKAVAKLHHTNIVPVFGVGEADGVPYYAMQFIRGEPLDKVLADIRRLRRPAAGEAAPASNVARSLLSGRFDEPATVPPAEAAPPAPPSPPTSAVQGKSGSTLSVSGPGAEYARGVARLGLQVAEALTYAHKQGILHRDIKPSNLLLDQQGTVWITDFGLAKAEGSDDLTQTGDIVGTVRFMAPERFDGRSLPQSDVYALGLTLYELLTLRPVFDDLNKARLVEKVLHDPPTPPRKIDLNIPRDLETVVLKCLHKDPSGRYATAEALAEDLRRFLADRPIHARRSSWRERTWRWCRRNPAWAAMFAVSAVLLTVMAVGGGLLSLHLKNALVQSRKAELDRKQQLLESLVSEARARRFSGRAGQRFGTLESIRKAAALARELEVPPTTFDELRDLAISALTLADIHQIKEWEGWPEGSRDVAFDAAMEHYARGDAEGNITVRRLADDVEVARWTGGGGTVRLKHFDEDGRVLLLADAADGSVKRWRFGSGADGAADPVPAPVPEGDPQILTADRQLLVGLSIKTGVVAVHDRATGKHLRDFRFGMWAAGARPALVVAWSMHPWRHELALAMGEGWSDPEMATVRVLDLDRGTVQAELSAGPQVLVSGQMSWHPDGRTLAVGYSWNVLLWDVPSRTRLLSPAHQGGGLSTAISPSGQLMSTHSTWAGGVKFWHPHTGRPLLSMPSMQIHPTAPAPDGRLYAHRVEGTRLQLWATEPSPVLRVLIRGPARGRVAEYRGTSVHPGGRLLAVGTSNGVSLFDLARGVDVGHLDIGSALSVKFDPSTGDLLTRGILGLLRWPVHFEAGPGGIVPIGPPVRLSDRRVFDWKFDVSQDGKVIALAGGSRALVLSSDPQKQPLVLQPGHDCRDLAVSPDGRWVATGNHGGGDRVHVWDAHTGELVTQLPIPDWSQTRFSPDGQWLIAKNFTTARFWRVGTWDEASEAPPGNYHDTPAFDPSGGTVAYERGDGALRLVEVASGRPLAALESPDQGRSHFSTFTPDGSTLIATNMDTPAVHVWNLHELRRRLAELELDWPGMATPAPSQEPSAGPPRPLELKFDHGGQIEVAKRRQAAVQLNNDAWELVAGPAEKRDPTRALQLIRQAMQQAPDDPLFLNTLGVIQYRDRQFQEAATTLAKSLAAGRGESDAFDLFFLAMCYAKLGDAAKAKDHFDRAVKWTEAQKELPAEWAEELKTFRAEAEEALGKK